MKILITGNTGFVGNNLVDNLKKQHEIYGLDIVLQVTEGVVQTFGWEELDQIPSVDVMIHLAGKAHDTKKKSVSEEYFAVNTELTKRIFEYFISSHTHKFIHFSSVKAVAELVNGILTEEVIPTPSGPYGESKLAAEQYILGKSLPEQKRVYILRPCMIHGPGNKGNLNLLYKLISKGIPWPLGAFKNKRSFTSIENLQYIISEIIAKEIAPGIYNVADDKALSTNTLIKLCAESQGKKVKIWNINSKLITFMVRIGDVLHLPLNSERLRKLTESYVVSNCKLRQALSVEKMPVTSEEGMISTFKSL